MRRVISWFAAALSAVLFLWVCKAAGSDFGSVGLLKLPTARMAEDGELRVSLARGNVADIYNITYQVAPWIETSVRYSIFNPRNLSFSADTLRDRSYESKARLFDESLWFPAVALGVRDILGTGVWEAEYFVATKKYGDLDFSIGIGWGRLGARGRFDNPLSFVDSGFEERPQSVGGIYGGESRSKSYFRGPAASFGGIRYRISPLSVDVLLEYESDNYSREVGFGTVSEPSPWNFGLEWRPQSNLGITASWLHGDSIGIRLSASLATKSTLDRKSGKAFFSSSAPPLLSRVPQHLDLSSWYDKMLFDFERSGLKLNSAQSKPGNSEVVLEVENTQYALTADAIHKTLSLSELHLPRSKETVSVLLREQNHLAPTIRYERQVRGRESSFFAKKSQKNGRANSKALKIYPNRRMKTPSNVTAYPYPSIAYGADLSTRFQLMDPDAPFAKQLYAKLSARISMAPSLNLWAVYGQDIYNDFTVRRKSNSLIQRVRSDVNYYLTEGESGIDQLFLEYRESARENIHVRSYIGILESMYAGVGAEVLYEPFARRWAVGATVNALQQRDFKKNLGLRDYGTITGFISAYYASPWYNLDLALHVGRYLARDNGGTIEFRRSFDNGFSIGGFFTRTNLPARLFGEGSFDKGLFFKIPLNALLPGNTKGAYSTILRPLERDGGRRLEDFSGSLWFMRRNVRFDALSNNLKRMIP